MISFEEFKKEVTLGYMPCENKLCTTMFFQKFSKYVEIQINVFIRPGQTVNMPFDKLKMSINDKIYLWYQELQPELEQLYPEKPVMIEETMFQPEFDF